MTPRERELINILQDYGFSDAGLSEAVKSFLAWADKWSGRPSKAEIKEAFHTNTNWDKAIDAILALYPASAQGEYSIPRNDCKHWCKSYFMICEKQVDEWQAQEKRVVSREEIRSE